MDEKDPLRCGGYSEQDLTVLLAVHHLDWRTDKADREYKGLSDA